MAQAKLFHCNEKFFSDLFKKRNKYLGFKASLDSSQISFTALLVFHGKKCGKHIFARFWHTFKNTQRLHIWRKCYFYLALLYEELGAACHRLCFSVNLLYLKRSTIMSSIQRPYLAQIGMHITFSSFHACLSVTYTDDPFHGFSS